MRRPTIVNAVASCLCSLMLLASAGAQDAAKKADPPKLDITYEQAQTLFGGKEHRCT